MSKAVLITGGNLGSVAENLEAAREAISREVGVVERCSSVLESEAWGFEAEERFLIREQVFFGTDRRVLVFVKDGRRIDGGVFFFDLLGKQEETHLLNGIRHEILAPCTFLRKAIFCADHNIQIGYIFRQRNREILNPRFAVIV